MIHICILEHWLVCFIYNRRKQISQKDQPALKSTTQLVVARVFQTTRHVDHDNLHPLKGCDSPTGQLLTLEEAKNGKGWEDFGKFGCWWCVPCGEILGDEWFGTPAFGTPRIAGGLVER